MTSEEAYKMGGSAALQNHSKTPPGDLNDVLRRHWLDGYNWQSNFMIKRYPCPVCGKPR